MFGRRSGKGVPFPISVSTWTESLVRSGTSFMTGTPNPGKTCGEKKNPQWYSHWGREISYRVGEEASETTFAVVIVLTGVVVTSVAVIVLASVIIVLSLNFDIDNSVFELLLDLQKVVGRLVLSEIPDASI